ncbi:oxalurate catabolism protein HpxZ [Oleomonas cavernae]|uniref:Oxalurate catabolism protein HpxZ n=1 Tax=Oleomonas cavernae TaxID=2320859 RepID=A0A418WEF8_9PROT|nr:oxalurate catabolism protein HpxZ [Oleomonas cavernae]RJF88405.1 oxalurate catabolism protein HpxZ [Oleomonas cavernae]
MSTATADDLWIDHPNAVAEIKAAFEAYERALMTNDTAALGAFFWNDPRVLRFGPTENLYGPEAIANYRSARDVSDLARRLENTRITAFGPDLGVANTEYVRLKSGKRGRQTQVWARLPDGWRVVSAHVSLLE